MKYASRFLMAAMGAATAGVANAGVVNGGFDDGLFGWTDIGYPFAAVAGGTVQLATADDGFEFRGLAAALGQGVSGFAADFDPARSIALSSGVESIVFSASRLLDLDGDGLADIGDTVDGPGCTSMSGAPIECDRFSVSIFNAAGDVALFEDQVDFTLDAAVNEFSFDVSAFAGQSVGLLFDTFGDVDGKATVFTIDDVRFVGAVATPAPTVAALALLGLAGLFGRLRGA